jgi:hypothetical protein
MTRSSPSVLLVRCISHRSKGPGFEQRNRQNVNRAAVQTLFVHRYLCIERDWAPETRQSILRATCEEADAGGDVDGWRSTAR